MTPDSHYSTAFAGRAFAGSCWEWGRRGDKRGWGKIANHSVRDSQTARRGSFPQNTGGGSPRSCWGSLPAHSGTDSEAQGRVKLYFQTADYSPTRGCAVGVYAGTEQVRIRTLGPSCGIARKDYSESPPWLYTG
jgi:hypothetical protein